MKTPSNDEGVPEDEMLLAEALASGVAEILSPSSIADAIAWGRRRTDDEFGSSRLHWPAAYNGAKDALALIYGYGYVPFGEDEGDPVGYAAGAALVMALEGGAA